MKQKLLFLKNLLLFGFVIFLISCQPEEEIIQQEHYQSNFSIERINHHQFKTKSPRAFGKMELLQSSKNNTTAQARIVNINSDFYVDTAEILQITKGNKISFTLPVYRSTETTAVENLVLTLQADNSYTAKIISYTLTENERISIKNGMFIDLRNKMQIQSLDNATSLSSSILSRGTNEDCYNMTIEYEMCCHNIHSTLDILNGGRCTCPTPPSSYTYVIESVPCSDSNGGGWEDPIENDPLTSTSGGQSNTGGGTANGTGTGSDTTPTDNDNNEEEPIDNFEDDLTLPLIIDREPATPCESLKTLLDPQKTDIQTRIASLKALLNEPVEYSVSYKKYSNPLEYVSQWEGPGTANSATVSTAGLWFGSIHSHPVGTYPMFSWRDLELLKSTYLDTKDYGGVNNKPETFVMIVCSNNEVYSLKVNDIVALSEKVESDWNNPFIIGCSDDEKNESIDEMMQKIFASDASVERAFLNRFSDYGITVYKANDDLTNWSALSLETDIATQSTVVKETPCN